MKIEYLVGSRDESGISIMELLDKESHLIEIMYMPGGYDPYVFRTTDGKLFKVIGQAIQHQRGIVEPCPEKHTIGAIPIPESKKIIIDRYLLPSRRRAIKVYQAHHPHTWRPTTRRPRAYI